MSGELGSGVWGFPNLSHLGSMEQRPIDWKGLQGSENRNWTAGLWQINASVIQQKGLPKDEPTPYKGGDSLVQKLLPSLILDRLPGAWVHGHPKPLGGDRFLTAPEGPRRGVAVQHPKRWDRLVPEGLLLGMPPAFFQDFTGGPIVLANLHERCRKQIRVCANMRRSDRKAWMGLIKTRGYDSRV